jgi:ribonucleoside-diphosphate reductase alpha chain
MTIIDWRARLSTAIDASGKSARELSLAAGKGPGYVHSILKEGKDPTIDNLLAICSALNISVADLISDVQFSNEMSEIIDRIKDSKLAQNYVLKILHELD